MRIRFSEKPKHFASTFHCFCAFLVCFILSGCSSPKSVESEFKWIHDVLPELGSPIQEEKEWYAVYQLTDIQLERLLAMNFSERGYSRWEPFPNNFCLGEKTSYFLSGTKELIQVCRKHGSDSYSMIAIFIEVNKKRLVLFYGITYGC